MLYGPSSCASVNVRPIKPHFEEAYGVRSGYAILPAIDDMLMIFPPLRSIIDGMMARLNQNGVRKLICSVLSQSAGATLCAGAVGPPMPALLTRMSTGPRSRATDSARESICESILKSTGYVLKRNPRL